MAKWKSISNTKTLLNTLMSNIFKNCQLYYATIHKYTNITENHFKTNQEWLNLQSRLKICETNLKESNVK